VGLGEVVELLGTSQRGGDAVPAGQELLGELASEAAGRAGHEPGPRSSISHDSIALLGGPVINDRLRQNVTG
jgi:hypothetical protein